ncbi:hypothetical protein [Lacrimispora sp.]|uniref:hypothetical protein n=1 Tax=Lacrimispora sp. TaxID=2719234 RepID=UPI0028B01D99|nr:hypothetical protein [Lacrimispora sp.]
MTYKIMTSTSNGTNEYWSFVKVDSTSTTDFSSTVLDDVEAKLKELMKSIPITKIKVITEIAFTSDLIFI